MLRTAPYQYHMLRSSVSEYYWASMSGKANSDLGYRASMSERSVQLVVLQRQVALPAFTDIGCRLLGTDEVKSPRPQMEPKSSWWQQMAVNSSKWQRLAVNSSPANRNQWQLIAANSNQQQPVAQPIAASTPELSQVALEPFTDHNIFESIQKQNLGASLAKQMTTRNSEMVTCSKWKWTGTIQTTKHTTHENVKIHKWSNNRKRIESWTAQQNQTQNIRVVFVVAASHPRKFPCLCKIEKYSKHNISWERNARARQQMAAIRWNNSAAWNKHCTASMNKKHDGMGNLCISVDICGFPLDSL